MGRPPWDSLGPRAVLGLAGLTLAAIVLRAIGLDGGRWFDEIAALIPAYRDPWIEQLTTYPDDIKHPLYSLLAWGS
ncbi:MAG: hypothetical protein R3266_09660, partial [Gemmatimonadota bacterium]|nr:hypothetical protein [Gemmatimonadota bacterium]